jgi:hypothetical protein
VEKFSTDNILDSSQDNSFGRIVVEKTAQNGWQQIETVL